MLLEDLIPVLQIAIGPVILISGVGLLLLTMTNRFGRIIDRSRQLAHEFRSEPDAPAHRQNITAQLQVLTRRARIVRIAIAFSGLSVLLAALLIIFLFLISILDLEIAWPISILFSGCMVSLILSLIYFMVDINISLTALKLEVSVIEHRNS
jgi:hypothetical protein